VLSWISNLYKAFMAKVTLPLYLDSEVKDDLKKLAKVDGRSMSKFIESVLKDLAKKARKMGEIE
jgi:hypothetical protein